MSFEIIPKELLRYWIDLAPGAFSVADLSRHVENQQVYIDMLERFVNEGVLDRHGVRRGWYIPRKSALEKMDYKNAEVYPCDIWLPLGLSDLVELYDGNIVILAGAPNAGKTALLLNMIWQNEIKGWDVHYFNSEMSAKELRLRLEKFGREGRLIDSWKFNAYYRNERFADVIFSHENALNIIDFLEVYDEFYVVGKLIKEIHDRMKHGICVIAIQKNPGSDIGLGGYRSMEVTRLAISIDSGRVKITKAKNFRDGGVNPNGWTKKFGIIDGCVIADRWNWENKAGEEQQ